MKTAFALSASALFCAVAAAQPAAPKGPPDPQDQPPAEATGSTLDRVAISAAVAKVKPKMLACGDKHPAQGTVKAKVKVAPSGKVTNVEIMATPDAALGNCVAQVWQSAAFAKTDKGGSFSYPFAFTKPAAGAPATPPADTGTPEALDRKAISEGIDKAKPAVVACGDKHKGVKGAVKVVVKVKPDGTVQSAEIKEAPKPELGTCVSDAILKVTFRATKSGGSFSYPFVF